MPRQKDVLYGLKFKLISSLTLIRNTATPFIFCESSTIFLRIEPVEVCGQFV